MTVREKLWDALGDLTTMWREGGKGSAWSSRRIFAGACIAAFVASLFGGLVVLTRISGLEWPAVVVFVPAALSLVGAIFFSYFATLQDLRDTIKDASEAVKTAKSADLSGTH
jgi:hypothetical protein